MVGLLAPGGKLYIEVPDQSDLYIPGHLRHFTGDTLRLWAGALGLEGVQIGTRHPASRPNVDFHLTAVRLARSTCVRGGRPSCGREAP